MSHCLSVSCYKIVVIVGEVDEARLETTKDGLDQGEGLLGTAMVNEYLVSGITIQGIHP